MDIKLLYYQRAEASDKIKSNQNRSLRLPNKEMCSSKSIIVAFRILKSLNDSKENNRTEPK